MNFNNLPFHDIYEDHLFFIYPFIKYNENHLFGSFNSPNDNILSKLTNISSTSSTSKVYIYRDLEYHLINTNINVIHNKIIHTNIYQDMLIKIEKHEPLNNDSFPKLNKYHDEYEKNVITYNFGSVTLNLVKITKELKTFKYIEITFIYKKNILHTIIKDLDYINQLFNNQLNQ